MTSADLFPNFLLRQKLVASDLMRLDDPCVLFEHCWRDSDGEKCWAYTIGGWLDGHRLADGCTIGGEVVIVHAPNRREADYIASLGLQDTIDSLHSEAALLRDAKAAQYRLASVGVLERMEAAMKPANERSEALEKDVAAIRPLVGDDIVLTVGGVAH